MEKYDLPYFGPIDLTDIKGSYRTATEFANNKLSLDLNFDKKQISRDIADSIKNILSNIEILDEHNLQFIQQDFRDRIGYTFAYIAFYIEECDEEELLRIVGGNKSEVPMENRLLAQLRLIRVGLYPDERAGADCFGVFDYSIDIDGRPCNQLLVVRTNSDGVPYMCDWES